MTERAARIGPVAFIGLGMMGLPMAARLVEAGFEVRGSDLSPKARAAFAARGGTAFAAADEAAGGTEIVITMLPDGRIVRDVLVGAGRAAETMAPGGLVIDMSSSAPLDTRALAAELTQVGLAMIDAPVSGGVRRADNGSLAVMAGGEATQIERARPLLETMGNVVFATGPIGSGHAVKALNNYVSAAGLAAACEAVIVAERFGVDPEVLVDVLNASTGRNNSTELKLKPFILSRSFASGFSMALMAKDLRTAADLGGQLGLKASGTQSAAELWTRAAAALGRSADHTEIFRYLETESGRAA